MKDENDPVMQKPRKRIPGKKKKKKEIFLQRRYTNGRAHKKLFNVINYFKNALQNHMELLLHTH